MTTYEILQRDYAALAAENETLKTEIERLTSLEACTAEGKKHYEERAAQLGQERDSFKAGLEDVVASRSLDAAPLQAIAKKTLSKVQQDCQEIRSRGFAITEYNLALVVLGPPLAKDCLYDVVLTPKRQY